MTSSAFLIGGLGVAMLPAAPPIDRVVDDPVALVSSTYHCSGYAGCRSRGYSDGGYGAVNNRMYWRMYAGNNCTNYVAYRLIQAGMPTARPWSGTGMAYNWGHANRRLTNQTPAVGAVAWWDRGAGGMSSSGHVAIVERVISPNQIVISEDSWGGTFSWRTITKSRSWPTGFIHFPRRPGGTPPAPSPAPSPSPSPSPSPQPPPTPLRNSAAPTVSGVPAVGQALEASPGTWEPAAANLAYQWNVGGTAVPGATGQRFTPRAAHLGERVTVTVTADAPGHPAATATSAATEPVAEGTYEPVTGPVLAGDSVIGQTLQATAATWSPRAGTRRFVWRADGVRMGHRGPTLTLDESHLGKTITVTDVARGPGVKGNEIAGAPVGPVVRPEPAATTLDVRPHARQRHAIVGIRVGSASGPVPDGQVRVTAMGRSQHVNLRNGFVRVRIDALRPGARKIKVVFLGNEGYARSRTAVRANVRP